MKRKKMLKMLAWVEVFRPRYDNWGCVTVTMSRGEWADLRNIVARLREDVEQ